MRPSCNDFYYTANFLYTKVTLIIFYLAYSDVIIMQTSCDPYFIRPFIGNMVGVRVIVCYAAILAATILNIRRASGYLL